MNNKIRVAIVDDHSVVRQGMRMLLTDMNMDVVGEAASGNGAVDLAESQKPDVMLLDIRMKDGDGIGAIPHIKSVSPLTQVIMLTTYSNPAYLSQAMQAGAIGYLLKESDIEEIVDAIQIAAKQSHLIDRTLLAEALQQNHTPMKSAPTETYVDDNDDDWLVESLSDRENDVLRLMTKGFANAEIADQLNVSISTVKTHVKHILRKLNVNDRTQAALLAVRQGLVD